MRSFPVAALAGAPLLAAAWIFELDPPNQGVRPGAVQVVAIVAFLLVVLDIFVLVPAIFLFNQPKRLVPPHMRDQPGLIARIEKAT